MCKKNKNILESEIENVPIAEDGFRYLLYSKQDSFGLYWFKKNHSYFLIVLSIDLGFYSNKWLFTYL